MSMHTERLIVLLVLLGSSSICFSDETKQNNTVKQVPPPAVAEPQPSEKLELLVRKYSSVSDLGDSGTIQLVWLNPELLDAMVNEYGDREQMTPGNIRALNRRVQEKLEGGRSLAFLIIFKPKEHAFISQPDWSNNGTTAYPAVVLRGTGNRLAVPQKWSQILGEGDSAWYCRPTSGYLIYKARDSEGRPYLEPNDFSFSVLARTTAERPEGELYDVKAEFHFDSMPVQLQQIVDASLPAGNNSLVTMTRRVPKEGSRAEESSYRGAGDYPMYAFEANSASLTRPEILQIIGLGIAFAQLAVAF